jgi:hypothetical protein
MSSNLPGLGINLVPKHKDKNSIDSYIRHIKELRMDWVRLEFNFYSPEEDEVMDYLIERLYNENISILGLLTGLVPGNLMNCIIPSLKFQNPLDVLEKYSYFCSQIVQRYSQKISHWEIWNEPNTLRFWIKKPDSKEYTELVKNIAPVIKKIQPEAKIILGGIMGDDRNRSVPFQEIKFLDACLELGIDDYIDVYSFHPYVMDCYFSFKSKKSYIPLITEAIFNFTHTYSRIKKPFWVTEIAICPKWVKVTEEDIGEIYSKLYEFCLSRKMNCFFWVLTDFKGPEYSSANPETSFGFLDWELNPKPLYKSFIQKIGGK